MGKRVEFPTKAFETLPNSLNGSNYIDFLLLLAKLKPALRIKIDTDSIKNEVGEWCVSNGFAFLCNRSNYACIALAQGAAERLQQTDDSCWPHEYQLGRLLGYPECCCNKIADVGEENIDEWERVFIQRSRFEGQFVLISPAGYREGRSLISHIPCSSACRPSLDIALAALRVIMDHTGNRHFCRWECWTIAERAQRPIAPSST